MYWDDDGFVIVYKRLEEGTFRFPAPAAGQAGVTLRAAELASLVWLRSEMALTLTEPVSLKATVAVSRLVREPPIWIFSGPDWTRISLQQQACLPERTV